MGRTYYLSERAPKVKGTAATHAAVLTRARLSDRLAGMMVKVKICGVTSVKDALAAVSAGADALGFNFYRPSPRYIEPVRALAIREALPPFVATVGVFVDAEPDQVQDICRFARLDCAQLHGRETPRMVGRVRDVTVIKAIRIQGEDDLAELERYNAAAYLLDSFVPGVPGGTGMTFDWDLARRATSRAKVILAGGLTPENVAFAVASARPYAVDVASGVETTPGVKSRSLLGRFVRAAKEVEL